MRSNTGQILYIPKIGQRANFQHPLMKGCVGWWPLTDSVGDSPIDISGNSETLTNGGISVWGLQSVGNIAITNNNSGAYYSSDTAFSTMIGGSTPATDPWSISFWISTYLTAPYYYEDGVLSIGSSAADGTPFLIVQRSGSNFRVYWGGVYTNISGISHRTWTNVTITFNGSVMNCYTNGTLGGTRTSTGTNVSTSDKLWIGTGYNNVGTTVDDYFQNIRVWNRALSESETLQLYTNPWSGLSMPSATRYFFVPPQIQQIFPPRMKLKTSINVSKGGRIVI